MTNRITGLEKQLAIEEGRYKDKVVDIEYRTGSLDYEKIRQQLIQQVRLLESRGYRCSWKTDLNLSQQLDREDLLRRGYLYTHEGLIYTEFKGKDQSFKVLIYPTNKKASVEGRDTISFPRWHSVKYNLEELGRLIGIEFKVNQVSNPY